MKKTRPKSNHKPHDSTLPLPSGTTTDGRGNRSTLGKTRQRYAASALLIAVSVGAALMLLGYPALGKGLILGTLFSVLNFWLMAAALPLRLGKGRGQSFLFSIISIYLRYALMALPLVWAFKQEAFAVSSAAAGLFMVQFAILGDHLLARWRHLLEAG